MALMYVTLAEAKSQVRQDLSHDDAQILLMIQAASGAVKNYLKGASAYEPERDEDDTPIYDSDGFPEIDYDSDTPKVVRMEVKQAVLILLAEWYKNREATQGGDSGMGYLPAPAMNLLYPLRDPACK